MARKQITFDTPFRKGDKVTATVGLPGVPEGTGGVVKLVNGLTWTRYWVFFDNGENLGSIDQKALVRSKQWAEYRRHRETEVVSADGAGAAVEAADSGGDAPAAAAGAGSRIPEHLLDRTKKRKEALGIG